MFNRAGLDTDKKGNTIRYEYDGLGRVIRQISPFDEENDAVTKNYYDTNSNVVKQMVQNNKPGEAESFRITEYKYDNRNLLTKMITDLMAYEEKLISGDRSERKPDGHAVRCVWYSQNDCNRGWKSESVENTYNNLGQITVKVNIVHELEGGALLHGALGVSPITVRDYFRNRGYRAVLCLDNFASNIQIGNANVRTNECICKIFSIDKF